MVGQTRHSLVVSIALGIGYAIAMIGVSVAFVNRMAGPMVALNRHARALKSGRFNSRVQLRGGGGVHAELAQHLNELAIALEGGQAGWVDRRAAQPLLWTGAPPFALLSKPFTAKSCREFLERALL